jgi:hypothetical protein
MRHSLLLGLTGLGLLLVPSRAEAQWSARLALEAPLYVHASEQRPEQLLRHQRQLPAHDRSHRQLLPRPGRWRSTSSSAPGLAATGTGYSRQRTSVGPGVTFDDPTFPLYGRLAFPVQVESSVVAFLRTGGGLKILDMAFPPPLLRGDRRLSPSPAAG